MKLQLDLNICMSYLVYFICVTCRVINRQPERIGCGLKMSFLNSKRNKFRLNFSIGESARRIDHVLSQPVTVFCFKYLNAMKTITPISKHCLSRTSSLFYDRISKITNVLRDLATCTHWTCISAFARKDCTCASYLAIYRYRLTYWFVYLRLEYLTF